MVSSGAAARAGNEVSSKPSTTTGEVVTNLGDDDGSEIAADGPGRTPSGPPFQQLHFYPGGAILFKNSDTSHSAFDDVCEGLDVIWRGNSREPREG